MFDWVKKLLEPNHGDPVRLDPDLRLMLDESLRECEVLYRSSACLAVQACPDRIDGDKQHFVEWMRDLHRGFVVKILVEIAKCDRIWDRQEREVARTVLRHVWASMFLAKALPQSSATSPTTPPP